MRSAYTRNMFKRLGLYRQLQFSHLLVTLLTALILMLCILVGYGWYASSGEIARWAAADILEDANYVATTEYDRDSNTITPERGQEYINEFYWPFLEPDKRDGIPYDPDDPDWYSSSLSIIVSPEGVILGSNYQKRFPVGARLLKLNAPAFQADWLKVRDPVRYDLKKPLLRWAAVSNFHIGFAPIISQDNVLLGWWYRRHESESLLQFLRGIAGTLVNGFLGAAAIAVLTSALVGNRFARGMSARLGDLSQLSRAYASGDFSRRYRSTQQDEIGQLGEQFNRMAEQIESQMLELRHLAGLNTALLEESKNVAALEERQRLARDLHDAVKQQLFGLNLNIAAIKHLQQTDPQEAARQLEHAGRLTETALLELDAVIQQLRPVSLGHGGLAAALDRLLKDWSAQTGIVVEPHLTDSSLPTAFETALYRIAQEGLQNVARHARAKRVTLELSRDTDTVQLLIRDDGVGFDPFQVADEKHLGLKSIRERAQALGGALSIESTRTGTTLRVHLPLEREVARA